MQVQGLTKYYNGKKVVDNVSFDISKGKITAFIGPNGAGKSTVLNMIARLIKADSGNVLLENKNIRDWDTNQLAKTMAILTQHNNINMKLTVFELVSFGRFPYSGGRLTEQDIKIIDNAISYLELGEFKNRFIDELSGGQRQRAYIAMILAQDTNYIILDEPTNNLDIYHSSAMMQILRRLCDDFNKTIIVVLHDINLASYYADEITAFKNGKLYLKDASHKVMQSHILKNLYQVDFEIIKRNGKAISLCV